MVANTQAKWKTKKSYWENADFLWLLVLHRHYFEYFVFYLNDIKKHVVKYT